MSMSATYSPEDNKLRLYSATRLDKETYDRVRAAGFIWAPKQDLFVAPMWTPEREDLLTELCGEIGDEDTSLAERTEQRAERFENYSERRAADAESAHAAVHKIADGIPFGQPILVGHHSEKRARKDAEKIQNGMDRAVKMWDESKYWKARAAGAIHAAKYKELPQVRFRRIKGLEAEIRRCRAEFTPADNPPHIIMQEPWRKSDGEKVPHVWCGQGRGGKWVEASRLPALEASYSRAIKHCENRLEYERAMLGESGGLAADKFNIEVGGQVLYSGTWVTVLRVNRKDGKVCSMRTSARYCSLASIEDIRDYQAPSAEESAKVASAMKKGPLCNYPGKRFGTLSQEEWDKIRKESRGSREIAATETMARHRVRICLGFRCHLPPKEGKELEPSYCDANRTHHYWPVFITDAKVIEPPAPKTEEVVQFVNKPDVNSIQPKYDYRTPEPDKFDVLREQAKAGVKVVSANQLFPTPPELAKRAVALADVQPGQRVLEPSAGTGNLLRPIFDAIGGLDCGKVVAVEQNYNLVETLKHDRTKRLYANEDTFKIVQADFLECNGDLGKFDRVVMNPPFENGSDIKHIQHALTMLKPGGKLVAICANGPRQNDVLKPMVEENGGEWEVLPEDTFKSSGTGVRTVLLTMEKAA